MNDPKGKADQASNKEYLYEGGHELFLKRPSWTGSLELETVIDDPYAAFGHPLPC